MTEDRQVNSKLQRSYDDEIRRHYDAVASAHKDSSSSTMEDAIVRAKETDCIHRLIRSYMSRTQVGGGDGDRLAIVDVGCGNGYTLSKLAESLPQHTYTGVEFTDSLRVIARQRFAESGITVFGGDLRDRASLPDAQFDVLVCQRVLINLLDPADQSAALSNVVGLVKDGGLCIFIEAFQSGLNNLNNARREFDIPEIPPAQHNRYLDDGFFDRETLRPWQPEHDRVESNLFSTHYYVTRVFHEVLLRATSTSFIRNSHFVQFWSRALPEGIGDYSPLRVTALLKGTTPENK